MHFPRPRMENGSASFGRDKIDSSTAETVEMMSSYHDDDF